MRRSVRSAARGGNAFTATALWKQGLGMVRSDGSPARLLIHHYSLNVTYWDMPWGQPSPDADILIFNSNVNGTGRYTVFLPDLPLRSPLAHAPGAAARA